MLVFLNILYLSTSVLASLNPGGSNGPGLSFVLGFADGEAGLVSCRERGGPWWGGLADVLLGTRSIRVIVYVQFGSNLGGRRLI
ncbi:hypothetical protein HOY82DRAFT_569779 [Tuber indicum]|nr:hypothetical protein HOY82DRAFT_569779 [Tuber indicum]